MHKHLNINDCYLHALQKSEQNLANGGIKLDKPRFVQLFNSEQNRLVKYYLERKDDDAIRDVQRLLVYNKKMKKKNSFNNPESFLFELPEDFFEFVNVSAIFGSGGCSAKDFHLWEAKQENVNELTSDENNKPSYDYRETFYTVGQDGVNIYTDGFDVKSATLTYYRYPVQVDISGYLHSDGTQSSDVDPEFDDKIVNIILNMVEKAFALNEGDTTQFTANRQNIVDLK